VAHRGGSVQRIAVPLRAFSQRFAFVFLALAASGLMMLGKADHLLIERLRGTVADLVVPVMDFVSRPAATISAAVGNARELFDLRNENARLRAENDRLIHWQETARQLYTQNEVLRDLLRFVPEPEIRFATARVVADTSGAFVRSMLINAGANQGVAKGQAVVAGEGLVGRIESAGVRSARVLLITDLNSRIPIRFESSRRRAILAGDNSGLPRLEFLSPASAVEVGDRIVTSGHGGAFPPGLPVGRVASVADGIVRIQPYVDLGRIEYVRAIDFEPVAPLHAKRMDPSKSKSADRGR
jgi:rod shape-determining protein MreC